MADEITAAAAASMANVQTTSIQTQQLSTTTQAELEAYGITATDGMSESEAQEKIQEAKQEQQAQMAAPAQVGETEVTADIKSLATTLGIKYSDDATADELLTDIADELEAQIDEAGDNPQVLTTLLGYYRELSQLDSQFDEIKTGQDRIYAAMQLLSDNNKQALGLE